MQVKKQTTSFTPIDIDIKEITLLSEEEVNATKDNILPVKEESPVRCWWWLRTHGNIYGNSAAIVRLNGSVDVFDFFVDNTLIGVRPALRFNPGSADIPIRNKLQFGGYEWTVIAPGLALCDNIIDYISFRKDAEAEGANIYETSDVKAFIDQWLESKKAQCAEESKIDTISANWIPISEGLPKRNCETWVTIKNGDTKYVTAARFWVSERSWDIPGHNNITAWMPKPAPYHG